MSPPRKTGRRWVTIRQSNAMAEAVQQNPGRSYADIARQFDVSPFTVRKHVARTLDVPSRGPGRPFASTVAQVEKALSLRRDAPWLSLRAVARAVDLPITTLRRALEIDA